MTCLLSVQPYNSISGDDKYFGTNSDMMVAKNPSSSIKLHTEPSEQHTEPSEPDSRLDHPKPSTICWQEQARGQAMISAIQAGVRAGQQAHEMKENAGNITDNDLQRLPRPELRLKSFSVQSLNMASKRWEPRELHLTSDNICFGKKDSDIQIDCIPLDEILQVHHTEDQRGRTGRERFADGARRLLGLSQTEGAAQSSTFLQQFSSRHLSAGSDDERALAHPKSPKFNVMYAASYKAKGDDVHGLMLSDPCLIRTIKDGFNSGRVYRIRTSSQEELKRMMHDIQNGADARWEEKLGHGLFWWQRYVKNIYDADAVQSLSALIIMGSFLLSILSSELDNILEPDRVQTVDATFERIELVIVVVFTVELAMNAFGNWFLPFIQSPWNIFDVFVVVVCWLAVGLRCLHLLQHAFLEAFCILSMRLR